MAVSDGFHHRDAGAIVIGFFSEPYTHIRRYTAALRVGMQAHRATAQSGGTARGSPGRARAITHPRHAILVGLWAITLCTTPVAAQEPAKNTWQTINYLVENDSFLNNSDKHYTGGLYLSWTSGEFDSCEWCAWWSRFLMLPPETATTNFRNGYHLGQSIFTPSNLFSTRPNPRERPFAGWLFLGARLSRESVHVFDRISGSLGVVGPWSGADATQRWWHSLDFVRGVEPRGWVNQIKNELGFTVSGQRIWRISLMELGPVETELLPEVNASIGNVFTYAGTGVSFRVGHRLKADWGAARIEPALTGSDYIDYQNLYGFGLYAYVGFDGRAVLRNITLDGNSFQDSANVAKMPLVGDLTAGVALLTDTASFRISYIKRTKEFHTQRLEDEFLSINVSARY